ncbi:hemoglobin cathodic subunit beta-like [Denticeps clupeoides]|uniref:Globin domain-containing protein n=1 Tax=Denticeps clupeoides TaxID=299321 RepID=A0AAY4CI54_9TELE|nr:hemoglobin cathodic subunit beta-like [Denticeps clupeoides]
MVEWSDNERAIIADVWSKIDVGEIGPQTLARVLIVYPWTRRYFGAFGELSSVAVVLANRKVATHGRVVLNALDVAVRDLDNIKSAYSHLSSLHRYQLHVDPANFRLLADCLTIVIATKFGAAFSSDVQSTWHKFMAVVIAALGSRYF